VAGLDVSAGTRWRGVGREEVAVPAQHRVWRYQEAESAQRLQRKLVEQWRQERAISRGEPHLVIAELPVQHRDLVTGG
jgi:hypothetical protein